MQSGHGDASPVPAEVNNLGSRLLRPWLLLAFMSVLSALALAFAHRVMPPEPWTQWGWVPTRDLLLAGVPVLLLLLGAAAVVQQRRILARDRQSVRRAFLQCQRLKFLLSIGHVLEDVTDLQTLYDSITHNCLAAYDCNQVSLMVLNDRGEVLVVQSVAGASPIGLSSIQRMGMGVSGWVAHHRQSLNLGQRFDRSQFVNLTPRRHLPSASMVVPVGVEGELYGVLSVTAASPGQLYDADHLEALEAYARNAALLIQQMRLHDATTEVV